MCRWPWLLSSTVNLFSNYKICIILNALDLAWQRMERSCAGQMEEVILREITHHMRMFSSVTADISSELPNWKHTWVSSCQGRLHMVNFMWVIRIIISLCSFQLHLNGICGWIAITKQTLPDPEDLRLRAPFHWKILLTFPPSVIIIFILNWKLAYSHQCQILRYMNYNQHDLPPGLVNWCVKFSPFPNMELKAFPSESWANSEEERKSKISRGAFGILPHTF